MLLNRENNVHGKDIETCYERYHHYYVDLTTQSVDFDRAFDSPVGSVWMQAADTIHIFVWRGDSPPPPPQPPPPPPRPATSKTPLKLNII